VVRPTGRRRRLLYLTLTPPYTQPQTHSPAPTPIPTAELKLILVAEVANLCQRAHEHAVRMAKLARLRAPRGSGGAGSHFARRPPAGGGLPPGAALRDVRPSSAGPVGPPAPSAPWACSTGTSIADKTADGGRAAGPCVPMGDSGLGAGDVSESAAIGAAAAGADAAVVLDEPPSALDPAASISVSAAALERTADGRGVSPGGDQHTTRFIRAPPVSAGNGWGGPGARQARGGGPDPDPMDSPWYVEAQSIDLSSASAVLGGGGGGGGSARGRSWGPVETRARPPSRVTRHHLDAPPDGTLPSTASWAPNQGVSGLPSVMPPSGADLSGVSSDVDGDVSPSGARPGLVAARPAGPAPATRAAPAAARAPAAPPAAGGGSGDDAADGPDGAPNPLVAHVVALTGAVQQLRRAMLEMRDDTHREIARVAGHVTVLETRVRDPMLAASMSKTAAETAAAPATAAPPVPAAAPKAPATATATTDAAPTVAGDYGPAGPRGVDEMTGLAHSSLANTGPGLDEWLAGIEGRDSATRALLRSLNF